MTAPLLLALRGGDDAAVALPEGSRFTALRRLRVEDRVELVTGDWESCAIVLRGTFDLRGGPTGWPNRGARATPSGGRPVAVFLPPQTAFAAEHGRGEILLIGARQPARPAPSGRDALRQSPLLPMAGSGKAFDPTRGEWLPAESFANAAESLPPRRIERHTVDGVVVERVFAADYKAAALTVDELHMSAGATFAGAALPQPPATECLVYAQGDVELRLEGGSAVRLVGEQAALVRAAPTALVLTAAAGPAYCVVACAGK